MQLFQLFLLDSSTIPFRTWYVGITQYLPEDTNHIHSKARSLKFWHRSLAILYILVHTPYYYGPRYLYNL